MVSGGSLSCSVKEESELVAFLKMGKMFETGSGHIGAFDILQSDPRWERVKGFGDSYSLLYHADSVFSQEERLRAQ